SYLAIGQAPSGTTLLGTSGVIPQHTLAMTTFVAWALLALSNAKAPRAALVAGFAALAALPVISTLLCPVLLVAYGLMRLYRDRIGALPELIGVGLATITLTLVLGTVDFVHPGSAIESPLLTNVPDLRPAYVLVVLSLIKLLALTGIPALLAIW